MYSRHVHKILICDFPMQELTAIKLKLKDLTREVERLRSVRHSALRSNVT